VAYPLRASEVSKDSHNKNIVLTVKGTTTEENEKD